MATAKAKAKAKAKPAKPVAKAKTYPKAKAKATTASRAKAKAKATTASRAKAKAKAPPTSRAKPKASVPTKVKAKLPPARAKAKASPAKQPLRGKRPSSLRDRGDAVPAPIATETSTEAHRRLFTARDRAVRSSPVVEILDDPHPIGALRRFLDSLEGEATQQQAQIALGSAQLMLLSGRDERGSTEVKELVDLVVHHWNDFGERKHGFHAQEFLKHAFAALGVDRTRASRLEELIPDTASAELLFNVACAYAVARDKVAMLRAIGRALDAGAPPEQFRRDTDFAPYANDPDLMLLLARAEVPHIPVDIEPYLPGVRAALDSLLSTLKEFGESVELRPPMRLDAILDAERAAKISLPNDYRALLTITNGMRLWEHEFFAAGDYREATRLATRAQHYLGSSLGITGIAECVPVASWGQPTDWLLYDPRGRMRGGYAGYVLMLDKDGVAVDDLATALAHMENMAREVLGTN
jgi:hypothetical protein